MSDPLKIAILAGIDSAATRCIVDRLRRISEVQITAILLDTEPVPATSGKPFLTNLIDKTDDMLQQIVPREEVEDLLRKSHRDVALRLGDFDRLAQIPLRTVENFNSVEAIRILRQSEADLGIVLDARPLNPEVFLLPSMGCWTVLRGKVPQYRGEEPVFWQLFHDEAEAAVTVHHVDQGMNTGDVILTRHIPIHENDTEATLHRKLDLAAGEALAEALGFVTQGKVPRLAQKGTKGSPNPPPTWQQRMVLASKRGPAQQNRLVHLVKNCFYLWYFHFGVFRLVQWLRGRLKRQRAAIVLFHRVNDDVRDGLTTSLYNFAAHAVMLRRYYHVVSTDEIVAMVREGRQLPPNSVAIQFDDCYRQVHTNAARILHTAQLPACAFINSGFVGTDRMFQHDKRCPVRLENLSADEVRGLVEKGFLIGAHTVNHADLGVIKGEEARLEIEKCGKELERIIEGPIPYFAYPFGAQTNITKETRGLVKRAGYKALFSAYGGYIGTKTKAYDIPRVGGDGLRSLDLLMQLEGLSFMALRRKWSRSPSPTIRP